MTTPGGGSRRCAMGWWNEPLYVNDDGLRWYFSERDRGGPSRLDCYRRLLSVPANRHEDVYDEPQRISEGVASVRRFADLFHPWAGSRSHSDVGHALVGR